MKDYSEMTVLLLEDQPLIAMDTEAMLRKLGFDRISHLASLEHAFDWLSTVRPDLAIMESALWGESSEELSVMLQSGKIPSIVYSGANRSLLSKQSSLLGVPWISKPTEPELMGTAIDDVLRAARGA